MMIVGHIKVDPSPPSSACVTTRRKTGTRTNVRRAISGHYWLPAAAAAVWWWSVRAAATEDRHHHNRPALTMTMTTSSEARWTPAVGRPHLVPAAPCDA